MVWPETLSQTPWLINKSAGGPPLYIYIPAWTGRGCPAGVFAAETPAGCGPRTRPPPGSPPACACARACAQARESACVRIGVRVCVRARSRSRAFLGDRAARMAPADRLDRARGSVGQPQHSRLRRSFERLLSTKPLRSRFETRGAPENRSKHLFVRVAGVQAVVGDDRAGGSYVHGVGVEDVQSGDEAKVPTGPAGAAREDEFAIHVETAGGTGVAAEGVGADDADGELAVEAGDEGCGEGLVLGLEFRFGAELDFRHDGFEDEDIWDSVW